MMKNIRLKLGEIKNSEYIILFALVLVGFLVRLYKIENPVADWHSWRQADTASVSRIYFDEGVDLLYPRYYDISTIQTGLFNPQGYRFVEFPLYNFATVGFAKAFSFFDLEIWGRLLSIAFSLLSSILLFWLGKRFISKGGGILTAAFFLFIPFNIYFSRVILPEPFAVVLGLLSLVYFVSFLDTDKFWKLLLSGAFLALAVLVKPFILFYSIPMILLLFDKFPVRKLLKSHTLLLKMVIFSLTIFIPFILWRFWISNYPEGIPFWKWAFNGDEIRFRPSFWRWIFGERIGHLILGSWGLVAFVLGLLSKAKNNFDKYFFLGALLYLFLIATANVRHDYYQTLIIPAISLILARGTLWLWESKDFDIKIARLILIFSLFLGLITGALQIKEFYKINHPEIVVAGSKTDDIIPKDALVIVPYNADTAFLYQTKRFGWPFMDRSIEELIEKGANYYISVNFDTQTNELMEKFEIIERTQTYVILDLNENI